MPNQLSNINDQIIISIDNPLTAIDSVDGFSDSIDGVTADRVVIKEFSYTTDLIDWSDWILLTDTNLQQISIDKYKDFNIRYRYTRSGSDDTGDITFNWINLATSQSDILNDEYSKSPFNQLIPQSNNSKLYSWYENVLKKVFYKGIVPSYINRSEDDVSSNRDYLDFWRLVVHFFSFYVNFAREFQDFDQNKDLLNKYLTSKGLYVNSNNSIDELQEILSNIINEFSSRGTLKAFDGEVSRLINKNVNDEFALSITNQNGWLINATSPLNRLIHNNSRLKKLPLITNDVLDIPIINSNYTTINSDNSITINQVPLNQISGIGLEAFDENYTAIIDPSLCYELRFFAKGDGLLSVSIDGFDDSNQKIDLALMSPLLSGQYAIKNERLISDDWQLISVIIYPSTTGIVDDINTQKPNIGVGYNLRWTNNIVRAGVRIILDNVIQNNTIPNVDDSTLTISHGQTQILQLQDFIEGYTDAEDDGFESISIQSVSGSGDLLINNIPVTTFPITITGQQLIQQLVQYRDDDSDDDSKSISISYTVNDIQPIPNVNDILYIRDIEFKLLSTDYSKGIIGSPILIETWMKNNGSISFDQLDSIITQNLIPYNTSIINNEIDKIKLTGNIPITGGLYEERYEEKYQ